MWSQIWRVTVLLSIYWNPYINIVLRHSTKNILHSLMPMTRFFMTSNLNKAGCQLKAFVATLRGGGGGPTRFPSSVTGNPVCNPLPNPSTLPFSTHMHVHACCVMLLHTFLNNNKCEESSRHCRSPRARTRTTNSESSSILKGSLSRWQMTDEYRTKRLAGVVLKR